MEAEYSMSQGISAKSSSEAHIQTNPKCKNMFNQLNYRNHLFPTHAFFDLVDLRTVLAYYIYFARLPLRPRSVSGGTYRHRQIKQGGTKIRR